MSLPATLPQAILDTILDRLALFFLAASGDDMAIARNSARHLLSDYHPQTARELNLAAEVIIMQLHSFDALCTATPDLPDNKVLRLRACGISLSREQHKAHRKLDQIQKARRTGIRAPESEPVPPSPKAEKAIAVAEAQRVPAPARTPTLQSFRKLEAARLITENLKKRQAEYASQTAAIPASAQSAASNAAGAGSGSV